MRANIKRTRRLSKRLQQDTSRLASSFAEYTAEGEPILKGLAAYLKDYSKTLHVWRLYPKEESQG